MSYTPFNAPLVGPLLGDREVAACFSVQAELQAMLRFQGALAAAEARCGVIPTAAAEAIARAIETFEPDIGSIGQACARDGVVVPELVRQLRAHVGPAHGGHVHFGATSQDMIDTAFILRLKTVLDLLAERLAAILSGFADLAQRHGTRPLTAYTRMQPAIPMTAADRIANWRAPVAATTDAMAGLRQRVLRLQFGGAVGTLDKLGDKGAAVRAALAEALELTDPDRAWHSDRSAIVGLADWLSLLTGGLGKFGQDIALTAENGTDIALSGGGGSSAMPHKQNPVGAETLVALGRFNATLVSGMHQSLIHENERSGAAWTLEWMLLPQMAVAAGAATRHAAALISAIERIGRE